MQAALATLFAGSVGAVAAAILSKSSRKSWRTAAMLSNVTSGVVAGLVSSSALCGIAPLWGVAATATVAAVASKGASNLLARAGVDDVASVVPNHLVGGIVSVLSVGFFADPDYLRLTSHLPTAAAARVSAGVFIGGNGKQLLLQLLWLVLIIAWGTVCSVPLCLGLRAVGLLRSDPHPSANGVPGRIANHTL